MTYETAKLLKEKGFPQTNSGGSIDGGICNPSDYRYCICKGETHFSIPTLEELIEACRKYWPDYQGRDWIKDNPLTLKFEPYRNEWECGYEHFNETSDGGMDSVAWVSWGYSVPFGSGKTPSEAVAKMWLELKKRTDI